MTYVIQQALDAVSIGCLYALIALSLSLLFGVMGLVNFAYGQLIMVGGYTMVFLRFQPWPVLVIVTVLVCVALSFLMERVAFRPLRSASFETLLVASFAVGYMLQYLAGMTMGTVARGIPPWDGLTAPVDLGGVVVTRLDLATLGTLILLLLSLRLLLRRTMLGIHLRASTEDFDMARLVGVQSDRVIASAFVITGALAGAVSLLYFARFGAVDTTTGFTPVLIAFVGGVIGGLGSLGGATLGGFALGSSIAILQATLPVGWAGYTGALAFAGVIIVLVLRPQGLAGSRAGTGA